MIVRPIIYTAEPVVWRDFARACGGTPVIESDAWTSFSLGRGRLGIHRADSDNGGVGGLGLEVPDLRAVSHPNAVSVMAGHGPQLRIEARGLPTFFIDELEGTIAQSGRLIASPLLMTSRVLESIPVIEALGLKERTRSDAGTYIDFEGDGVLSLHALEDGSDPRIDVSFEHPDIDELADHLRTSGYEPAIIDESYARTLRIDIAEFDVWINETQTDFYGYTTP